MGNQRLILFGICGIAFFWLSSCEEEPRKIKTPASAPTKAKIELVETPVFNGDSAYVFVEKQVAFGPRVPNTPEHKACAKWLEMELKRFGLETIVQEATVTAYNGNELDIYNIMGRYRPELSKRIMLSAHWDTRPYADRGNERRNKPIDGANDGASGVGVLLELARAIAEDSNSLEIGYDIVFFDAEDYGKPQSAMTGQGNDSWCLGSQYWSSNIPFSKYNPEFGILLDMVGATDAIFPKEGYSVSYAPEAVEEIWSIARAMGHGGFFSMISGNPLIDDHLYINKIAGIPTVDIIHYEMLRNDFGTFHHTHEDNMDLIDKGTLNVVGDVVLQVLYQQ